MNRTLFMTGALALGMVVGALVLSGEPALADKITIVSSSGAVVDAVHFYRAPDGGVQAQVCGHSNYDGGTATPVVCHDTWLPSGAFQTNVLNVMNGSAKSAWQTLEGL